MNRRIDQLQPSASVELMAKAKAMKKMDPSVIGLAGGEPDFDTPERISVAAIRSLTCGNTHYAVGPGLPELRAAIRKKLAEENGALYDADNIIVTPGGKNAIYLAVRAVLNEGDEAIILNPAWVSYEPIILSSGGIPVNIELDYSRDYEITAEALEEAYTDRTRLLIINYPNNPTGRVLHENEADILENFLLRHPQVYLLSDEVYEKILFEGSRNISMASRAAVRDRVITVNSFSKSVAMTGWRVGYLAASREVYRTAYKLYQHSLTCMSAFIQAGAVAAFDCTREMEEMRRIYQMRRDMFINALNEIKGVQCKMPEGAFYAWARFDVKGMTSAQMSEYLLEKAKVVGMPGEAYGEKRICCLRFSFATSTEDLREAASRIKTAVEALQE